MSYGGAPRIDWQHPLARGLSAVALPNGVYTKLRRSFWSAYKGGVAGISSATTSAASIPSSSSVSFVVVANMSALSADALAIGRARYNATNNFGAELRFNAATLELNIGDGSASWFFGYRLSTVTVGRAAYGGTFAAGGIASSIALHKDGVRQTLTGDSAGSPVITAFDGSFDVGQNTASGATAVTGALGGAIEVGLYYATALTDMEMAAVQFAALQGKLPFIIKPRVWVPVALPSGGTTFTATLTASTASAAAIAKAAASTKAAATSAAAAKALKTLATKSAATTAAATLSTIKAKLLTLAAAVSTSAAVVRSTRAIRSASSVTASAVVKSARIVRAGSSAAAGVVVRTASLVRSASTATAASAATVKAKLLTLIATVGSSATVTRAVKIVRLATTAPAGTVAKLVRKTWAAATSLLAFLATFGGGTGPAAPTLSAPPLGRRLSAGIRAARLSLSARLGRNSKRTR